MFFEATATLLFLSIFLSEALAAPAGSKHNIYLVKCEPNECPIGLCDPGEFTIMGAALFRNGPVTSGTRVTKPDVFTEVSGYRSQWEGAKRTVRMGTDGTLTSNISSGAAALAKGQIAGDATLGSEPFTCFKDGSTKFTISRDGDAYTCTTSYWCPSVDVSI
ncbi:uncharacterized protein BDR25DRAFT_307462 [Lindgomyces ingoldianus]|uniref:Uncharacterized protein n=1 Tax=Lindgomyces ingoldianus TaxID=673940 RepID=A0ACB6QCZ4_9PLEO|nr:uncharacterized protein BDR25DRAFT_307462 [Lindgomyces ingoldianus]KAF2463987.1 hypothetical protein BDR25DRAFT_307462 [Lindgomyces ingoldianus]